MNDADHNLKRLIKSIPGDCYALAIVLVDSNGVFKLATLDHPSVRRGVLQVAARLQAGEMIEKGTMQ